MKIVMMIIRRRIMTIIMMAVVIAIIIKIPINNTIPNRKKYKIMIITVTLTTNCGR